jgi:hypothetical protein
MVMNDSGDFQASLRRQARAASVSNRWWENESLASGAADRPAPTPASSLGPPPPPPPPPEAVSYREQARLRLELEAARDEIAALHEMLEDLPEIFERKFRQRLQAVLDHQQRLLADNQALREHLFALGPAAAVERPRLPPANEERWGLGRRLRHILRHDRGT